MPPLRTSRAGQAAAAFLAALGVLCAAGCSGEQGHDRVPWATAVPGESTSAERPDPTTFDAGPPPFSDPDIFPCTQCHGPDLPPNPKRRELSVAHDTIKLRHDEEHRWCLDCHDPDDRDVLRLANGSKVPFTESYRLCGQCHGDKYRDWRAGVHGRRTGEWESDGKKQYRLCVYCHDSHAPRFKPLAPLPPPLEPEAIR